MGVTCPLLQGQINLDDGYCRGGLLGCVERRNIWDQKAWTQQSTSLSLVFDTWIAPTLERSKAPVNSNIWF